MTRQNSDGNEAGDEADVEDNGEEGEEADASETQCEENSEEAVENSSTRDTLNGLDPLCLG